MHVYYVVKQCFLSRKYVFCVHTYVKWWNFTLCMYLLKYILPAYIYICIYIYIYNASYIPIQAYVDIQTIQICIVIYLRTNLHKYIQFLIRMAHTRAYIYIRTYIPVAGQEEIGTTIDLSILRGTEKLDFILWHMSAQMVCMYVCMYVCMQFDIC